MLDEARERREQGRPHTSKAQKTHREQKAARCVLLAAAFSPDGCCFDCRARKKSFSIGTGASSQITRGQCAQGNGMS
eukprot:6180046-Pleurochrysis_carterae.AAC.5